MRLIHLLEAEINIHAWLDGIKTKNGIILPNQFYHDISDFICGTIDITSLENCPQEISGTFSCSGTNITSLEFAPKIIHKDFYCEKTKINSLNGSPLIVKKRFDCSNNNIPHLKGIGRSYLKECKEMYLSDTIKSNILGLCRVINLEKIYIFFKRDLIRSGDLYEAIEIVKNHLETDGSECQEELIQNGFTDYAKF
jgi:hypothetical protein